VSTACRRVATVSAHSVPFSCFITISPGSRIRGCQQHEISFVLAPVVGTRHSVGNGWLRGPVVHPSSRIQHLHGISRCTPTPHQQVAISNVATTSGNWTDHRSDIALLLAHHLPRLTHLWLKLLGFVLTWRSADMKEHFVIDPLVSKRQQLLLATQLCRMVLKVCFEFPYCIIVICYADPYPIPSIPPSPYYHPSLSVPCLHQPRAHQCRGSGEATHSGTCEFARTLHSAGTLCFCRTSVPLAILGTPKPCIASPFLAPFNLPLRSDPNSFDRSTM
jgi:hypothetical protein